eukprot:SAG31_NODE_3970_length_3708_cov_1.777778_2_plen_1071_part_01
MLAGDALAARTDDASQCVSTGGNNAETMLQTLLDKLLLKPEILDYNLTKHVRTVFGPPSVACSDRERAYVGALTVMLAANARLSPADTLPPDILTRNDCAFVRDLMMDSTDENESLSRHHVLVREAIVAAGGLAEEFAKQICAFPPVFPAIEVRRRDRVREWREELARRPRFAATIQLSSLSASGLPGHSVDLGLVVRGLGPDIDDPEHNAVVIMATPVDPASGSVSWQSVDMKLDGCPDTLQLDLQCGGQTIGSGTASVPWHSAPHWKSMKVEMVLNVTAAELGALAKSTGVAARLGSKVSRLAEAKLRGRRRSVEAALEAAQVAAAEMIAHQQVVLEYFFERFTEPPRSREDIKKMLGQGEVTVQVDDEMFRMLCQGLEVQYGENPLTLWARKSVSAATVELQYRFSDLLQVSPLQNDWSHVSEKDLPDTGVGNFTDHAPQILKCILICFKSCLLDDTRNSGMPDASRYSFKYNDRYDQTDTSSDSNHGQVSEREAVEWIINNFADRFGLTMGYRKIMQLLVFVTSFHVSAAYLTRLKTMLRYIVDELVTSLTSEEYDVFSSVMRHVEHVLSLVFENYKSCFRPRSADMEITTKIAFQVLSLVAREEPSADDRLRAAFRHWPHRVVRLLTDGGHVTGICANEWHGGGSDLTLNQIIDVLEAISIDIDMDDTEYRFCFDSVNVADLVVAEYSKIVQLLVADAVAKTTVPDNSQVLMQIFIKTRNLICQMEVVSPNSHEFHATFGLHTLFRSVLQTHLRLEQVRIEELVTRMIETDQWVALDNLHTACENSGRLYSASAYDVVDLLIKSVQPLSMCWRFGDIAGLIGQILLFYCSKVVSLCESDLESAVAAQAPKAKNARRCSTSALSLPTPFWVRINNLHYIAVTGSNALCDQTGYDEDSEVFRTGIIVCQGRMKDSLRELIDTYVDHHCGRTSDFIRAGLLPRKSNKSYWLGKQNTGELSAHADDPWKQLRTFLDNVLDEPAQKGVFMNVIQKILKRLADGFSSHFEAILVGDQPLQMDLSTCVDQMQICLQEVSAFFRADGFGLKQRTVDRVLSISSRLGKIVQYHAF